MRDAKGRFVPKSQVRVERMRRHAAKTTPDRSMQRFDPVRDDLWEQKREDWLRRFKKCMIIKHGEQNIADFSLWVDDLASMYPGQVTMYVKVNLWNRNGR